MPTLVIYLALAAGILGGLGYLFHEVKESGREECRVESVEAARMAELRSRERGDTASRTYEAKRATSAARERTIAPKVAAAVASAPAVDCFTDSMRALIADDISQRSDPGKPVGSVSAASAPAGRD